MPEIWMLPRFQRIRSPLWTAALQSRPPTPDPRTLNTEHRTPNTEPRTPNTEHRTPTHKGANDESRKTLAGWPSYRLRAGRGDRGAVSLVRRLRGDSLRVVGMERVGLR
jgi:hypothetical protein